MSKYILTHFGEIDSDNLEEYYEAELEVNGRQVESDINFDEESIHVFKLQKTNDWLSGLSKLDELGLAALQEDFKSAETVREYIQHPLAELDSDDIKGIVKGAKKGATRDEKMLSAIKLERVGFYPHEEFRFITLDYTLNGDLTDQLIVLGFTADGKLHYITLEN